MAAVERRSESNLKELRCRWMSHLALLLMGTSGLAMWLTAFQHPWPIEWFGLLCVSLCWPPCGCSLNHGSPSCYP
jgi:hypothetical protein